jgi:hypothetical protein
MNHQLHYHHTAVMLLSFGVPPDLAILAARADAMVDWATPENLKVSEYAKPGLPIPIVTQSMGWELARDHLDPNSEIWRRFHFPSPMGVPAPGIVSAMPFDPIAMGTIRDLLLHDAQAPDFYPRRTIQAGMLLHILADSYSHAGFCAIRGDWNANPAKKGTTWAKIKGWFLSAAPATGHAEFGNQPDEIDCVWYNQKGDRVNNRWKFKEYARLMACAFHKPPDCWAVEVLQLAKDSDDLRKRCEEFWTDHALTFEGPLPAFVPMAPQSAEWLEFCRFGWQWTGCLDDWRGEF